MAFLGANPQFKGFFFLQGVLDELLKQHWVGMRMGMECGGFCRGQGLFGGKRQDFRSMEGTHQQLLVLGFERDLTLFPQIHVLNAF